MTDLTSNCIYSHLQEMESIPRVLCALAHSSLFLLYTKKQLRWVFIAVLASLRPYPISLWALCLRRSHTTPVNGYIK